MQRFRPASCGGLPPQPRSACAMKWPAIATPSGSMPWPRPGRTCHSTSRPACASGSRAMCSASAGIRSSASPWMSRIGGRAVISPRCSGPASRPEKPTIAAGPDVRRRPDVQRHHGALAEADEHETVRRQPVAGELPVEKAVERGTGRNHAAPILAGIAHGEPEPLQRAGHAGDRLRRIGRDERRTRERAPPFVAQRDQIVAVGAVAVQQHDQGRCRAPARLAPRPVQLFQHPDAAISLRERAPFR